MHTEHFEVRRATVVALLAKLGAVTAVGTTSVRTLESLPGAGVAYPHGGSDRRPGPRGAVGVVRHSGRLHGRDALEELLAYMDAKGSTGSRLRRKS